MALETSAEHPIRVGRVSELIGQWIDRLGAVWVEGQVTQVSRRPGASMVFMTLRDTSADVSITVTCYREIFDGVADSVEQGARVIVHAKPEWYRARGQLSLRAVEIRLVGIGELLARLERLRRTLAAEGLFAAERKRPLPFLPGVVGLVCGRASAAERDVLENARKRWPAVRFEVRNVAVQGVHAVPQVIAAVRELDALEAVEVIIVARGGGSVEDLLPFSDEQLVRAVADCRTPVVSAIGHEPDSPLLDLVADLRASTPTDAAKKVVPDVSEELHRVAQLRERGRRCLAALLDREAHGLAALRSRPVLADPHRMLRDRAEETDRLVDRARRVLDHLLDRELHGLEHTRARVLALSPAATLERGYAVLQRADGAVVRDPGVLAGDERLRARVSGGEFAVLVADGGGGAGTGGHAAAGAGDAGAGDAGSGDGGARPEAEGSGGD
ncbi:exodeoxyribonuclease VII large subunit [Allostreptomyces psammosilenae]|uniref:Exodeoxyribonuclease 7 large subunit n=1 Tax=Allostreptomyces psammosilenae TaxID=1892865 RepID=A0A853A5B3_9ACTN|nr:exodeoxyribonuclease VII large subunit [Allostreptomyces psammosilenae]NYI08054.1 exodeoxyribonuclease VII large subunit [Allostreptomyces psammosilenae]